MKKLNVKKIRKAFPPVNQEYLLVTDKTSRVLSSSPFYPDVSELAALIRESGGQVTIFKSVVEGA